MMRFDGVRWLAAGAAMLLLPVLLSAADLNALTFKKGQVLKSDGSMQNTGPQPSSEPFSLATLEAYQSADQHLARSALMDLPLPETRDLVPDRKLFSAYRKDSAEAEWYRDQLTMNYWTNLAPSPAKRASLCQALLATFGLQETNGRWNSYEWRMCNHYLWFRMHADGGKDGLRLLSDTLLAIASQDQDPYLPKGASNGWDPTSFQLIQTISNLTAAYAIFYPDLPLSQDDRRVIESYLHTKLLSWTFDYHNENRNDCPIAAPQSLSLKKGHNINNCADSRIVAARAELALAVVMGDELLWKKGLYDLDWVLSMIDDNAVFVPHAVRGCMARGYSSTFLTYIGFAHHLLSRADGFDLYRYRARHGRLVGDMIYGLLDVVDTGQSIAQYTERAFGSGQCGADQTIANTSVDPNLHSDIADAKLWNAISFLEVFKSINDQWDLSEFGFLSGKSYDLTVYDDVISVVPRFDDRAVVSPYSLFVASSPRIAGLHAQWSKRKDGQQDQEQEELQAWIKSQQELVRKAEQQEREERERLEQQAREEREERERQEQQEREKAARATHDGEYVISLFSLFDGRREPIDGGVATFRVTDGMALFEATSANVQRLGLASPDFTVDAKGIFHLRGDLNLLSGQTDCVNLNGPASSSVPLRNEPYIDCKGDIYPLEALITRVTSTHDGDYAVMFYNRFGEAPQAMHDNHITLTVTKGVGLFDDAAAEFDRFGLGDAVISVDAAGRFLIRGNLKLGPNGADCVNLNGEASSDVLLQSTPYESCRGEIFPLEMRITRQ